MKRAPLLVLAGTVAGFVGVLTFHTRPVSATTPGIPRSAGMPGRLIGRIIGRGAGPVSRAAPDARCRGRQDRRPATSRAASWGRACSSATACWMSG